MYEIACEDCYPSRASIPREISWAVAPPQDVTEPSSAPKLVCNVSMFTAPMTFYFSFSANTIGTIGFVF